MEPLQREREGQVAAAQAFARELAAYPTLHLGDAVKNALSQPVFCLALEGADPQQVRDELCRLARVISTV